MSILKLNELNSYFKSYDDKDVFFVLYDDISKTQYHALVLSEKKDLSGYYLLRFQDLTNGKIITDYCDADDLYKGHSFQDQEFCTYGYHIKSRVSLKDAVLMTGYREKETYTCNDIKIILANYNQICRVNNGVAKVYKQPNN